MTLGVAVFVGPRRGRAQRVLDAVERQTLKPSGVLVIDLSPDAARLRLPAGSEYRPASMREPLGALRAEAADRLAGDIIAYLEDHAYPVETWSEALLSAHAGGWDAVGYTFTNGNPASFSSRASFVVDYGPWMQPQRSGERELLPGNYVAYKRTVLSANRAELASLMGPDFNLQQRIRAGAGRLYVESRALVVHDNFTRLGEAARAVRAYGRVLAARRAALERWSPSRRVAYAAVVVAVSPALRLWRLAGRQGTATLLSAYLPVLLLSYASAALGECLGCLLGEGDAEALYKRIDFESQRDG